LLARRAGICGYAYTCFKKIGNGKFIGRLVNPIRRVDLWQNLIHRRKNSSEQGEGAGENAYSCKNGSLGERSKEERNIEESSIR